MSTEQGKGILDLSDFTNAAQLMDENVPIPASKVIDPPADPPEDPPADPPADPPELTAEEIAAQEAAAAAAGDGDGDGDGEGDSTVIDELNTRLGYTIEGEFSDDYEGVAQYTQAVGQKIADEAINDLFSQLPDVQKYVEYRMNGGDPAQFMERMNFSMRDAVSAEIKEDSASLQKQVVSAFLQRAGFTDGEISEELSQMEASEQLFSKAKMYQSKLITSIEAEEKQLLADQQEQNRLDREKAAQEATQIQELVKTGSISGLTIPEAEKKNFITYLSNAEARAERTKKLPLDSRLAMEYLVYKDFEVSGFISRKAASAKAGELKARLQGNNSKKMGGQGKSRKPVDLKSLLGGGDYYD